jgi:hypothetical protein
LHADQFQEKKACFLTARITGGGWDWIRLKNGSAQSQNQLILTV